VLITNTASQRSRQFTSLGSTDALTRRHGQSAHHFRAAFERSRARSCWSTPGPLRRALHAELFKKCAADLPFDKIEREPVV